MNSTTSATSVFAERPSREIALAARISTEEAAVVDRYAAARNMSRAEFVRAAIGAYIAGAPNPDKSPETSAASDPNALPPSPFAHSGHGAASGSVA